MTDNIFCQLILENCIKHMTTMPDNSVNIILCEPPYLVTPFAQVLSFDNRKDFNPMVLREHFERILAPQGNIICFTTQQANNKRNTPKYTYNEQNLTITQWANKSNINKATLRYRIKVSGLTIAQAIEKG